MPRRSNSAWRPAQPTFDSDGSAESVDRTVLACYGPWTLMFTLTSGLCSFMKGSVGMSKVKSIASMSIGLAAMLLASAFPAAAEATTSVGSNSIDVTIASPMTIVSYNRAVAAAHGYEIRTDSSGNEYSVYVGASPNLDPSAPRAFASAAAARPSDAGANCGTSFVHLTGTRAKPRMSTGFTVRDAVVFRKWGVTVVSPGVSYNYNMDGGPSGAAWSDFRNPGFAAGVTTARVNDNSFVLLVDGGSCYSVNPSTSHLY